jgi:hypothetical protein
LSKPPEPAGTPASSATLVTEEALSWRGRTLYDHEIQVTRHEIAYFARAISLERSVYFDVGVARAAGFPDIPAPRSFYICLGFTAEMLVPRSQLDDVGMSDLYVPPMGPSRALGAGGAASHHRRLFAGETVRVTCHLADVVEKRSSSTGNPLVFLHYAREYRVRGQVAIAEELTRLRTTAAA